MQESLIVYCPVCDREHSVGITLIDDGFGGYVIGTMFCDIAARGGCNTICPLLKSLNR